MGVGGGAHALMEDFRNIILSKTKKVLLFYVLFEIHVPTLMYVMMSLRGTSKTQTNV